MASGQSVVLAAQSHRQPESTGVTFDTSTNRGKLCGRITTNANFTRSIDSTGYLVTNKAVGANDVVLITVASGYTNTSAVYAMVSAVAEGSFNITLPT
jgi:hypothetical protein